MPAPTEAEFDALESELWEAFAPVFSKETRPNNWLGAFNLHLLGGRHREVPVDDRKRPSFTLAVRSGTYKITGVVGATSYAEPEAWDDLQKKGIELVTPVVDAAMARLPTNFWHTLGDAWFDVCVRVDTLFMEHFSDPSDYEG